MSVRVTDTDAPDRRVDDSRDAAAEPVALPDQAFKPDRKFLPLHDLERGWLVLVSNREPYAHHHGADGIEVERPAGGLVSALDPAMQQLNGSWVAWGHGSADRETAQSDGSLWVPPDKPSYRLRRVWLDEVEQKNFYLGYANQSLWPLCHLLTDEAVFRRQYWEAYRSTNVRFSRAVLDEVGSANRVVWVHDYHFALLPALLRHERPELPVSMFWHIPWPPYDVWRVNPQRRILLRSLLETNLLGFHVDRYVDNFLNCVKAELGDEVKVDFTRCIVHQAHSVTHVRALPISIDVEEFTAMATRPDAGFRRAVLSKRFHLEGRRLILGVDRLDYTKGLPHKLESFELFLDRYPDWREKVTLVQIASPSRKEIGAYQRLSERIRAITRRINERFGSHNWTPVCLVEKNTSPEDLTILYGMAEACWVTSLYDGMNLVASEYIVCADPQRGVLLLSEFAGAIEFLNRAITVNPYDTEAGADLLEKALSMPVSERAARLAVMRKRIENYTVHDWVRRNLEELAPLMSGRIAASF
jgi:alpha,alpha-trehalose-phosphate synthase [UDP-forming]